MVDDKIDIEKIKRINEKRKKEYWPPISIDTTPSLPEEINPYCFTRTIIKNEEYKIILFDEHNCIFVSELEMNVKKNDYKYISFFSLNNDTYITLSGMKYNIENYKLIPKDNLCLSNEIIDEANIVVTKKVLVFLSK